MSLHLVTAPSALAVSLIEAKAHVRQDAADDDTLITSLIGAATEAAEHMTGRSLLAQTWELSLNAFPTEFELTRVPVSAITSINYTDTAGATQTLASTAYALAQDDFGFALILPTYNTVWPVSRGDVGNVKVTYVAGYANAAAVPAGIKQWILLQIGAMYASRESETISMGQVHKLGFVDALLSRYKVWA